MYHSKPFSTKVLMSVFTVTLALFAVLGNGFVLAIIARFKSLRSIPNILVANLALVDLLNIVINMSLSMMYYVLEASWFRGKTLAIMSSILNRLFTFLNLASMFVMMVDAYLAISFEIRYHVRKTKGKALACVSLVWLIGIVLVMLFSASLFNIDLGDAHIIEYRAEIFVEAKYVISAFLAFFMVCDIVVYVLTSHAIRKKKKERAALNLPAIQAKARLRNDIKATGTITMTIVAHLLCYVPTILYATADFQEGTLPKSWFGFIAWYSIYVSSAVNPIIYYVRKSRFRSAFKQFLKDPCGSSNFKEKPGCLVNGKQPLQKQPSVVERDRKQIRKQRLAKRRNALVIWPLECSAANLNW